jgi:hypothetical protein
MPTPLDNWRAGWLRALLQHPGDWIIQGQEAWRLGRLYWHPKSQNDNEPH